MTTFLAQNQFISDSGTPPSTAVPDTAAADQVAPQVAAAEPIADPDGGYMGPRLSPALGTSVGTAATDPCQEPVAADCIAETCENLKFVYECTDGTMFHRCATCGRKAYLNATNDIPEIFRVAHQLCAGARQFVPDHHAIWDAMHDPGSPRALESDLVWADEAPLFLRMAI